LSAKFSSFTGYVNTLLQKVTLILEYDEDILNSKTPKAPNDDYEITFNKYDFMLEKDTERFQKMNSKTSVKDNPKDIQFLIESEIA
jgi:hypothetical protein